MKNVQSISSARGLFLAVLTTLLPWTPNLMFKFEQQKANNENPFAEMPLHFIFSANERERVQTFSRILLFNVVSVLPIERRLNSYFHKQVGREISRNEKAHTQLSAEKKNFQLTLARSKRRPNSRERQHGWG